MGVFLQTQSSTTLSGNIWKTIFNVFSLLFAVFIFILGNGLLSTLLQVRLQFEGYSSLSIGMFAATYYLGFVCGAFNIQPFIRRIGHIRAFSTFSSTLAITSLLHGMVLDIYVWFLLRIVAGMMTAGVFVVIESWLLALSIPSIRGRIFAFYTIIFYLGLSIGQLALNLGDPNTLFLFAFAAIMASLAVIPLSMTRLDYPHSDKVSLLTFRELLRTSPTGMMGCFLGGMVMGSVYGLLAIFLLGLNLSYEYLSYSMSITIFGGMCLQYPLGRLSDLIERRKMMVGVCIFLMISAFMLPFFSFDNSHALIALFIFGGLAFSIYPISISHACDGLNSDEIVTATQSLLMFYSIGAFLGPILASLTMKLLGDKFFVLFIGCISFLFLLLLLWRRSKFPTAVQEDYFMPMVSQLTPILPEIDPRGSDLIDTSLSKPES